MATPYVRKIKEYNISERGEHRYTDEQIRRCAQFTATKLGIDIMDVYKQMLLMYDEGKTQLQIEIPIEVRDIILGLIEKDDATYKALLQINKGFHVTYYPRSHHHYNQLWTLINKYPYKKWDWPGVFYNPNTTVAQIKKLMARNKIVKQNQTVKINWHWVACNTGIDDFGFISKHITRKGWYKLCSCSRYIFKVIEKYPNDKWDWLMLSNNPYLTMEFINKFPNKRWDWEYISRNKAITMQMMVDNPDKPWNDYRFIGHNPNLTIEMVDAHIDSIDRYAWPYISANPGIKMEDIEERLKDDRYRWTKKDISRNPNLTIDFVVRHPENIGGRVGRDSFGDWHWVSISQNPGITMKDTIEYPMLPWQLPYIFKNPNFTIDYAHKYPHKNDLFFRAFSTNPNLTEDFVEKHIDKDWDWYSISNNKFEKDKYYMNDRIK